MYGVALGNLNNGSNAGLSYLNGNNWLSRSWWNNAGRLSGQNLYQNIFDTLCIPRCGENRCKDQRASNI